MGIVQWVDNFLHMLEEDAVYSSLPFGEAVNVFMRKSDFASPLDFLMELKDKVTPIRRSIVQEMIDQQNK